MQDQKSGGLSQRPRVSTTFLLDMEGCKWFTIRAKCWTTIEDAQGHNAASLCHIVNQPLESYMCMQHEMDATVNYPSFNRSSHLAGLMPRDCNVAHAKYTFFYQFDFTLLCFLHTCSIRSVFVVHLQSVQHSFTERSTFAYRAFIVHCVYIRGVGR